MQDLNVAIVQCNQVWEDKLSNFRNYESLFTTLKEGVDLILLPEMFQTGFTMTTSLAENNKNSESILWLKKQAANNKAAIYTSLIIEEDNKTYNRGVFVLPDGTFRFTTKENVLVLLVKTNIMPPVIQIQLSNTKDGNYNCTFATILDFQKLAVAFFRKTVTQQVMMHCYMLPIGLKKGFFTGINY
jgi:hypothetical protein